MRLALAVAVVMLAVAPLMAETYSWTDENGTMSFADDLSQVPRKYRKKARKLGDSGDYQPAQEAQTTPKAAKPAGGGGSFEAKGDPQPFSAERSYGGKSMEAWRQELTAAEAELRKLDAKVKDLTAKVKASGDYYVSRSQIDIRQQQNDAVVEFNRASEKFDALVRAARKAGVPI